MGLINETVNFVTYKLLHLNNVSQAFGKFVGSAVIDDRKTKTKLAFSQTASK